MSKKRKVGMQNVTAEEICRKFYESLECSDKWKCLGCNVIRKKNPSGWTNLYEHIEKQHSDELKIFIESSVTLRGVKSIKEFLTCGSKVKNIFAWIEWIITENHPFEMCERELSRKYSNLEPISTPTLMKYLEKLGQAVRVKLQKVLPLKFGIILDGWSQNGIHFIGLFANYHDNTLQNSIPLNVSLLRKEVLLSFCPITNEEDLGSNSQKDFIEETLSLYGRSCKDLLFLVADNTNVNPCIAKKLEIPFIGCCSHKFNLAVSKYLSERYSDVIEKINNIMVKLSTIKNRKRLRKGTDLCPVKKNITRWTSTFDMIKRFLEIKDSIERHVLAHDRTLASTWLNIFEVEEVERLVIILVDFESVTKKLQSQDIKLSQVRTLFDTIVLKYEHFENEGELGYYLSKESGFPNPTTFENALVKLQRFTERDMTEMEKNSVVGFENPKSLELKTAKSSDLDFATMALIMDNNHYLKSRHNDNSQYIDTLFVSPTSNVVERLFSQAKHVYSDLRRRITLDHLETVIFLKINRSFWSIDDLVKDIQQT
jgi:hypothetical protein